jgi:hypothetical protein
MHVEHVVAGLVSGAGRNDTLGLLEALIVDGVLRLVACIG